jgi:hypothetical protein
MAIVRDLSGAPMLDGRGVDKPLSTVNRWLASSPVGVTTPGYTGELVQDNSTGQLWQAANLTSAGWIAVTKVV